MPRFVFGSKNKVDDVKREEPVVPVPSKQIDPVKVQLVTESMLLNAKLDHIIELLESAMSD